jgi:hypothetical protein
VIKNLTILPITVIPRIMPMTIARKTATIRVSLKTSKKRGNNIAQSSIVRQPVVKSFVSSMKVVLPACPLQREAVPQYTRRESGENSKEKGKRRKLNSIDRTPGSSTEG